MYSTNLSHGSFVESDSIQNFAREVASLRTISRIDHVILNAGILHYPNVGLMSRLEWIASYVDNIASY